MGSLVAVNNGWAEPSGGITVYIADNGIHADILMPVRADGLDWESLIPEERFRLASYECFLDRLRLGRGARLSRHSELVGHHPSDESGPPWPVAGG